MKKAAVIAAFCTAMFFGSTIQARAGTSFSFGITVGPSVPYYYAAPVSPQPYYAYLVYAYPVVRTVVVPRYYSVDRYRQADRLHKQKAKSKKIRKANPRSSRWRY